MYSERVHSNAVSGLDVTNEVKLLASCSVDSTVKIFQTNGSTIVKKLFDIEIPGPASKCAFHPKNNLLAISVFQHHSGLVCIDGNTGQIKWEAKAVCGKTLCVGWSPTENIIVTGGDNSTISIYHTTNGNLLGSLTGHKGWLWCLKFTIDGRFVLSGSSDRTLKVWNVKDRKCISTLGGHLHRVGWISLNTPVGGVQHRLATASLDSSIKIWDLNSVLSGNVPVVEGLHYLVLRISLNYKNLISSQGWMTVCEVSDSRTKERLFHSTKHPGFIWDALTTLDSNYLITVDMGHTGNYDVSF